MDNYAQLIEKISRVSGISKEELERKVEAKRAKLSGLVSKEGAAQIVAAELGVNFDKEKLKISELVQGMKRVNVVAKIVDIYPIRSYSKAGREGKVANLFIADSSGNAKAVLWDTNHISLIEQGKIKKGDAVEFSNAQVRNGEVHLGSFSDVKLSNEKIGDVVTKKIFSDKKIKDVKVGENARMRAVVVQLFEPKHFEVCPECGRRVLDDECKVHGKVEPKRRALLNVVLDDGSDSIRSVLFGETIYFLGLKEEEVFNIDKFMERKNSILGEEKFFSGSIKANALYNTPEFNVEQIDEINVDSLLKELEAKR